MKELGKDISEEGNFPQSAEAFKVANHIAKKEGQWSTDHKPEITDTYREKLKQYHQDY